MRTFFVLSFLNRIHWTSLGAFSAVAAFFHVNAELSLGADYYRMERTFNVAGRTADAFFLNYIMCHFNLLTLFELSFCA